MDVRQLARPLRINAARLAHPSSDVCLHGPKVATSGLVLVRHATHGTAGRANGPKNGPGKRLGAKKTGDQYVIPGNIIYRQRGAVWHPGDNVGMGRDHTIFALESGYVKYYKDPRKHPKRQYIGVVFNKTETLPVAPHAARRRRLNMISVPRNNVELTSTPDSAIVTDPQEISTSPVASVSTVASGPRTRRQRQRYPDGRIPPEELVMSSNYSFRESNWQIGRSAERAGIRVPTYKPGDRFAAWRKRTAKRAKAAEKRSLSRKPAGARKGKKK